MAPAKAAPPLPSWARPIAIPMAKMIARLSMIPAPAADMNGMPSRSSCPKRSSKAAAGNVAIGNIKDFPIFCRKLNIKFPPLYVFLIFTISIIGIVVYTNLNVRSNKVSDYFGWHKMAKLEGTDLCRCIQNQRKCLPVKNSGDKATGLKADSRIAESSAAP